MSSSLWLRVHSAIGTPHMQSAGSASSGSLLPGKIWGGQQAPGSASSATGKMLSHTDSREQLQPLRAEPAPPCPQTRMPAARGMAASQGHKAIPCCAGKPRQLEQAGIAATRADLWQVGLKG